MKTVLCEIIYEKTEITKEEIIDEDYLNEYDNDELDKPTTLFYKVDLISPFSQEINGVLYPLKNEEFNVLQIIDVVAR